MNNKLAQICATFGADKFERLKIGLLALTFFLVIGAYTVIYDLKSSIFISIVGKEYVPLAKILSMFVLIPPLLFYAFLVDHLRRYQLLYFFSIAYACFGVLCIYLIGHPTIGLPNTDSSPYRLFGWVFYFFVEGFSPFMVSVFWAFANSVNDPKAAKDNYGFLVAASKVGGMLSAGLSWLLLSLRDVAGKQLFSDAFNHQLLLIFFTLVVILVSCIVFVLMHNVPGSYLHGYEAVYKFEKEKKKEEERRPGLLAGLKIILERPYLLGIFGMLFFYEILNTILSYQRLAIAQEAATNISGISSILYQQMFVMHCLGFFISLFGTSALLKLLGERICLLIIPAISGALLIYFWFTYTPFSLSLVFIALKSVNYAFALPVRESLYIPTVKDVKFKSKSWIDAFGGKLARSFGSTINMVADKLGPLFFFPLHGIVFMGIIVFWMITAYFLGKRYAKVIRDNEVIG